VKDVHRPPELGGRGLSQRRENETP
jgi:hypothetical protein